MATRRRWLQFSLRSALAVLTVFAIWLLSRVDVQPMRQGIASRRGNSAVATFAQRKLLSTIRQIDRLADAVRHYGRGGGCIELGPAQPRLTIISDEPTSSWFHIWEPLQDADEWHREEQALLESLGPPLGEGNE